VIGVLVFDEKGLEEAIGNPDTVRAYRFRSVGNEYRSAHNLYRIVRKRRMSTQLGRPNPFIRREGDSRQKGLRKRSISVSLVKNGKKRIFFAFDEDADESY